MRRPLVNDKGPIVEPVDHGNRFWDYHCHRCNQTGSCPIGIGTSALNAVHLVADAHASFNPECHKQYQGRWIEIIGMVQYHSRISRPIASQKQ